MNIKYIEPTNEGYVAALCEAAKEVMWRADEIIGDVQGQQNISVTINLRPAEIVTIDVFKTYISGYKQRIYCSGKEETEDEK